MEGKTQNRITLFIQTTTLIVALIQNINLILQNQIFNFFIDKNIGAATSSFALILLVIIYSLLKDIYLDLSVITKKLRNLFLFLAIILLLFVVYILFPKFPISNSIINVVQSIAYLSLLILLFVVLINSITISIRNANLKDKKRNFPQNLLDTIKKYGAIYTERNLRILGSYPLQPQDFKQDQSPWLNRNLFKVDNFLTDGKKYWIVKTDLEGLEIFFTKEGSKEEVDKFIKKFLEEHPFFKNENP